MPELNCPDCLRYRAAIEKCLAIIRRMAGGVVADVRKVLEEATK